MESMIGYRFGTLPLPLPLPLPHRSIHISSGYGAALITTKPCCLNQYFSTNIINPRLSFSHSSFSLPASSYRGRPLEHIFGPMTFKLGHPLISLTDQKSRLPQAFTPKHSEEVVEVAKELKAFGCQDIALQLLKKHDPQLNVMEDAAGYCNIKMEIMQILIDKKKLKEASISAEDIEKNRSNYDGHFDSKLFDKLKDHLGSASIEEEKDIKKFG